MPRLSENAISFFGAGGHKHDGVSSTLISTDKYSLFDFNPGYRGSQSRITIQQANQAALEEWVMNLVNTKVLAPAGLDLAPGILSGKTIRANTITATELQANTITADEIAANAVTANELAANLVLVNNVIRSNGYNGTIAANNVITANGTLGWAITSAGSAEFSNAIIRGNVTANAGSIGGWAISSSTITAGSTTLSSTGAVTFGNTVIASNGQITNGGYTLSNTGVLTATGANINGTINASDGFIGGININASEIQSNGFSAGSAGFRIGANGNAEFNNVTVRGKLETGFVGDLNVTGGDLVAGEEVGLGVGGEYVKIDASGKFIAYKYISTIYGDYWVNVDINNTDAGITVRGTAGGADRTSSVTSSVVRAGLYHESATNFWAGSGYGIKGRGTYTYLGGDSDSISTGTMRVVNATALYDDPSTTSTNKLVCITSAGTLQVYGGVANTYATSGHSHSYSEITSKPSLMPLGGATVSNFALTTSYGNDATDIMFETNRSSGGTALSTRANGYVSASQFPSIASGSTVVRSAGFLYFLSSTIKIKENIEYLNTPILDFVKKLKPVKYTMKRTDADTDYTYQLKQLDTQLGFIVEDIEEIQNELGVNLITYDSSDYGKFDKRTESPPFSSDEDFDDIEPRMYKETSLISISIKAIQDLMSEIDNLKARIQALEGV